MQMIYKIQNTYPLICFQKCIGQTQQFLKEGILTEDKVFDSLLKLVSLCRDSNVTLRWLLLHTIPHYSRMLVMYTVLHKFRVL